MPLPFIIGGLAAAAAIGGVGSGIHGGMKMKEANDTMKLAKEIQERAINDFERKNKETNTLMDEVGKKELKVLASFKEFSELMEKIQNKPEFKEYSIDGVKLPAYEEEKLKDVSVGGSGITWRIRRSCNWNSRRICSGRSDYICNNGTWNRLNRNRYQYFEWCGCNKCNFGCTGRWSDFSRRWWYGAWVCNSWRSNIRSRLVGRRCHL